MEDRDRLAHLPRRRRPCVAHPCAGSRGLRRGGGADKMRAHQPDGPLLAGSGLMLGALAPAAREALTAAVVVLDHGARLCSGQRLRDTR